MGVNGRKAIATKWIYKTKNVDSSLDCFKAKLVAKGCSQKEGIDCEETFAPTSRMLIIRAAVATTKIKVGRFTNWTLKLPSWMEYYKNMFMWLNLRVLSLKVQKPKVCKILKAL